MRTRSFPPDLKVLVLDLDGTLLDSDKRVSERNQRAVLACAERGLDVIIATARPPRSVHMLLPPALTEICHFVLYNGGLVHQRGAEPVHDPVPAAWTKQVLEFCLELDPDYPFTVELSDRWFAVRETDFTPIMQVDAPPEIAEPETLCQWDVTKILLPDFPDPSALTARFGRDLHIVSTDSGRLLHLMSPSASKEQAVAAICSRLSLHMGQVIAFGDDANDLGLFRASGYPVAMGNAIVVLKELAAQITATNDEDGVAVVLERWLAAE